MTEGYELLDSGEGRRLERFAAHVVDRPAPQALWPRSRPEATWQEAQGRYTRSSSGGGAWDRGHRLPEAWELSHAGLTLQIRPTGFGHMGFFPEQAESCEWLEARLASPDAPPRVLNLFAYTGACTLAAARAGARVTHVDAARGMVSWARDNARRSGLESGPISWVVEDARTFVGRELRRGHRYHGLILDPPTYGRGPRGQLWRLEEDLVPLLQDCRGLLDADAGDAFVLLTAHTPGLSPLALRHLLGLTVDLGSGTSDHGEMVIPAASRPLPSGIQARWWRG